MFPHFRASRPTRLLAGSLTVALTTLLGVALPSAPAEAAGKTVFLTFDDGPSAPFTSQILGILSQFRVQATFFEVGQNVAAHPSLTRQVHLQGNSVQNHTWSHVDLTRVSASAFQSQVTRTDAVIRAQTGSTPKCLRPPFGATNSTVRSRAAALGKTAKLWTVDPRDWSRPGTAAIQQRVLSNVRSGSVILLHDGGGNRSQTVAALPTILRTLQQRGFSFQILC